LIWRTVVIAALLIILLLVLLFGGLGLFVARVFLIGLLLALLSALSPASWAAGATPEGALVDR
jgi:hypothetical protein